MRFVNRLLVSKNYHFGYILIILDASSGAIMVCRYVVQRSTGCNLLSRSCVLSTCGMHMLVMVSHRFAALVPIQTAKAQSPL